MINTKQTFSGKMVSFKANLCTRTKGHFIEIKLQAVVDGNLQVINAAVNELHERETAVAIHKTL